MSEEPRRTLRDTDWHGLALRAARTVRRLAPGSEWVSLPGSDRPSDRVARLLEEAAGDRPSAVRELGLAAVQVWQAFSRPGLAGGDVTILFTDLVGFSTWALEAGDDSVLRLLREVGAATEAVVTRRGGKVVKSLGDGVMAVFADTGAAIEAAAEACTAVSAITLDGYRPQLRTGLHTGRPRRVGRDYLGVDVNVAARVAAAAAGGEVLVSGPALATVDTARYVVRRRRRFRAKGTPKDLEVFSVVPRHA
ncbi:class 3 adenylate cyclase [Amycolatopsis bartoniae]|uniref:Adenylate and guanylate cyclase catalytic domain-containing protein n=1 Tax=Amycolatopsis bartoniae TaxID=941986 RepID=A0A8H9ISP3_9PSEU|nr:adenylate/guanylate cyclase domain-containing protein [Amycolatopsis bartoniae]MBB2938157.1 class 3 adenylate cyclase [Amycolatopsis bartoniae]TVT03238.1 adenylate/guanylate cyclase domain-containing protein [Amycolatopsis bartoniae]GHF33069.1 adenylate and guanylate cyclase catalytic domain-containing protein [Amycolatopsis bartoniae]